MMERIQASFKKGSSLMTFQDLKGQGIHPNTITKLVAVGQLEKVQRGLYRYPKASLQTHEHLVEVCTRVPKAVVCLGSALDFHALGTYVPNEIHIAIGRKAWKPQLEMPINVHYFSDAIYAYGIEEYKVAGHNLRVYSQEKTLVDSLRYLEWVGLEIFLQAFKDYLAKPERDIPTLLKAAKVNKVEQHLRPYLEALV
jgi:predicted transcriptional regulator of viral defense system